DLYQVGVNTINHHIKSIYDDGELSDEATIRQYRIVQTEGGREVRRRVEHYNLDMILAVGYWVRSHRGVQFRQWATKRLTEREIDTLNRIVVMFLDQAEFRALRRQDIKMRDWTTFLDKFLQDTELPVLEGPGSMSQEEAISWAETQYDVFTERRRLEAEKDAEIRYLDDLRSSAKTVENLRKTTSSKCTLPIPREKRSEKKK
ncbi:MAG: RhuM family protein, partial [Saprospiraceae bacterium]|nr:RhuM family protein [Saprospiraceae bacterium]